MKRLASAVLLLVSALALGAAEPELRVELTRQSLLGTHVRYRQYVDDLPVLRDAANPRALVRNQSRVMLEVGGRMRRARVVIREDAPYQPVAHYYDLVTNTLLYREPLYFNALVNVFDPNPVVTTNDPSLRDRNDAAEAVPPHAYVGADVDEDDLDGPHVRIVDIQAPNVPPAPAALYTRDHDGFEDVNAYVHIDRNQRYLQSLGYAGPRQLVPYAIPVDTHAQGGQDNSQFLPSFTTPGLGVILFGEGGTDDAEDADLLVHEYAHAIHEWIAPGTFGGAISSEARAMSEGFADYWAFSAHYALRVASGRDPFCIADWDARCEGDDASQMCAYPPGADCLRRVDSPRTMADYERTESGGAEYRNSAIWSSALREIHLAIGKRAADTIIIESMFGAPPRPTFAAIAHRMIEVDRALYGGAHIAPLCAVFSARGILPAVSCAAFPRGELTHFQSSERDREIPELDPNGLVASLTIDDPRRIQHLGVRVDLEHPARGDLRITLIAPDGTEVRLQDLTFERTRDIHTTYGIDVPSDQSLDRFRGQPAAGTWRLRIADLRTRDVGRLLSWGLVIQFEGESPRTERPRGAVRQMIPVVTHVRGARGELFLSEVRLANPSSETRNVMLVFTPSRTDGATNFAASQVTLAPRQTIAFADVVEALFRAQGSGSLEVLGDVHVASRIYTSTERGTYGQQVPANLETTAEGEPPLIVAPLGGIASARYNIGFVETAGGRGEIAGRIIEPYSHVQVPLDFDRLRALTVTGNARVAVYLSAVDNETGDAWFVAAESERDAPRTVVAPAITSARWRSDLWVYGRASGAAEVAFGEQRTFVHAPAQVTFIPRVLTSLFGLDDAFGAMTLRLPAGLHAHTRVSTVGMSQGVPFREATGAREHHLPWIESTDAFRTNIGIVSDGDATAEVIVYDSAGTEIERRVIATTNGAAQFAVGARVSAGRALVRILAGRTWAYASVVDNGTGDATLIN